VYDHLPVLLIDTGGVGITADGKVDGHMQVITEHDGTLTDLDGAPRLLTMPIGIELHGSSSTGYPKLSYGLEIRDETGADRDVDLLGLGRDSDWILIASYGDKSYVRDALMFELGRQLALGTDRYEPIARFVELFANDDYQGIYLLTGKIKRAPARIDLPAPAPDASSGDLSGGYIVKLECGRDAGWTTRAGTIMSYDDPQGDQVTPAQSHWLARYFDDFEAMLAADDFADQYPAWIDTDAWVDHILLEELSHNIDGLRLSTPLYKDADGESRAPLVAGPVWDYDRAWGNVNYCDCWLPSGWIQDDLTTCGYGYQFAPWWARLRSDPTFQDAMRCRWESLRTGPFADDALDARIAAMIAELAEAEPRDQDRWHTLGIDVGFNWYVGETWPDEISYLEDWIHSRTAWMDDNLPGSCGTGG